MPLLDRPFSVNTFALSKVWFRSYTINLREGDFSSINSSIKRWLYADQFIKPEEMVLLRPIHQGGLGLTSVRHKSLACLLRTFIELAANPTYITSQYLNTLYRVHVLREDLPCPSLPPYYPVSMFEKISLALDSGLDIVRMTTKQ